MSAKENHFAGESARRYDTSHAGMFTPEEVDPVVGLLTELAGEGRALELGVGTGRIALPLSAAGVPVHGIDLSEDMVAELRTKPGAEQIGATVGDFATTRVEGAYSVAFLVFNTINNLTTQDEQVACFRNAAEHLEPGGRFVVEVGVPPVRRLGELDDTVLFSTGPTHWGYDVLDTATQSMVSHHITVEGEHGRYRAIPFRYVWPSELDLMAQLAGLALEHRWADWHRAPFTSRSTAHVSVWRKPA
ncbi:class I SAM-dependent methyltransferase [Nocardiopsis sp. HNM0947]|uniref:Class I SAM-dependent methyltransferase n=1 Tax=Nocardiopsis coralli TaxID=2772213 RepID=A0ABR9PAG0_9ACTN|nr:class I SAM-dependent methyltransferase [Nocardiopsis coralli]MBE3000829.1 class I SAM-dependent methyltransferase [Nocardiopsis coralli]